MVRLSLIELHDTNYYCFNYSSLTKEVEERPRFYELIEHPYIKEVEQSTVDVAGWYGDVLKQELEFKAAQGK